MLDDHAVRDLLQRAGGDVPVASVSPSALVARGRAARRRRRALLAASTALSVVAATGLGVAVLDATGQTRPPARFAAGAAPDASSSAQDVVLAYLDAVNARDRTVALSLLTPRHAASVQRAEGGLFAGGTISQVRLGRPDPDYAAGAQSTSADGWAQSVHVPARYVSDEYGERIWGYVLVRQSDAERWSIADEGPV